MFFLDIVLFFDKGGVQATFSSNFQIVLSRMGFFLYFSMSEWVLPEGMSAVLQSTEK